MTDRTILITGGAGFVGHHMVEHFLKNTTDRVVIVDSLTYSGSLNRLRDNQALDDPRVSFFSYDFTQPAEPNLIAELQHVTHVLHMGAESHVDNSIENPMKFVEANVVGTVNMLNLARELPELEVFLYFSTDEVFGPAPMGVSGGAFKENAVHNPKNPYAASKSAAEQIVTSFANTYRLPCFITRQMNIFGERQHPEKFIPMCIDRILSGETIEIHATPDKQQAGVRAYIHARNVADAHLKIFDEQPWLSTKVTEVGSYHIVGEQEIDNKSLMLLIGEILGVPEDKINYEMVDFHSSRPGHDLRYALDGSEIYKDLGWRPPKNFKESLKKSIEWYLSNTSKENPNE
jgi:dTDP-glucose 4,6-dehydratase